MNHQQNDEAKSARTMANVAVIANAVELTKQVVRNVADQGDDVSTVVDGAPVTPAFLGDLAVAKLSAKLTQKKGG